MSELREPLTHPILVSAGVAHAFGQLGTPEPPDVIRPIQEHGTDVAVLRDAREPDAGHADAVVSAFAGIPVGVVTADCVPVLLAVDGGRTVAAIHGGWRGIAAGVVPSAFEALERAASPWQTISAVIGPHIGPCCYEVDSPVIERLRIRFSMLLDSVLTPVNPDHAMLDLGALMRLELIRAGVSAEEVGSFPGACTCCDEKRFHSYRRDGKRAGRMLHWIAATGSGFAPL